MTAVRLAFLTPDGDLQILKGDGPASRRSPRNILVVPGVGVMARWIDVKGSTPAQLRGAALAALASDLAASPDTCVAALGPATVGPATVGPATVGPATGVARMVCIAARADVTAWLTAARRYAFEPDAIIPDFALLSPPADGGYAMARIADACIVRGPDHAFACEQDMLPLLLGDAAIPEVDLQHEALRSLRGGALGSAPDFMASLPRQRESGGAISWPRILVPAFAALAIAVASPWIHAARLDASAAGMRTEASTLAAASLPEAGRIVNPRAQLEEYLLPYHRGEAALALTTHVLESLAAAPDVAVTQLDVDAEGGLRAQLSISQANALAPVEAELNRQGYETQMTPGATVSGRTLIDLVVRTAP